MLRNYENQIKQHKIVSSIVSSHRKGLKKINIDISEFFLRGNNIYIKKKPQEICKLKQGDADIKNLKSPHI